jgi:hypothetical protein
MTRQDMQRDFPDRHPSLTHQPPIDSSRQWNVDEVNYHGEEKGKQLREEKKKRKRERCQDL